ncbi:ATP-dependent DNA helicase UvrD2 [Corynebacterium choanae]|uniref:DNA 3'-5' helicase n=1 Tax=Corynebacterium choanae TaxID=1862358 RepID=A0A3G6J4Y1_9CORY|nr:ATP-dependent DNA helicase UvrD2 [Corynebacterium choanae]AZA12942.1 ATP-dependent DNA helicase UvrD2 [Corynebacterium choanae]
MAISLEDLDADQRIAAEAPRGPVCILAGAGTGKTRTITYRIASLIDKGMVSPQRMLAVTYTRKAAQEMRDRLQSMGIQGGNIATFHSATLRQLTYFWPQIFGDLPWKLEPNLYPLVRQACGYAGIAQSQTAVRDVQAEIGWAKASLIGPDEYARKVSSFGHTPPVPPEQLAKAYKFYEDRKTRPEGMILDYDDLLIHTAAALEHSPAVAEEFRNQYRSFTVDEYQDVTPLQQRVLRGWLGQRDDLTVVGDANQTIYSFTGATPDFLLNFGRDFPQATIVRLQRDYRSTPQITDLANSVIAQAKGRVAGTRLQLQGMRPSGSEPVFSAHATQAQEAEYVAATIEQLLAKSVKPEEIAVLFRTNAQSEAYESALSRRNITYQVRGGDSFYQRPEIITAINALIAMAKDRRIPAQPDAETLTRLVDKTLRDAGLSRKEPDGFGAKERWRALQALHTLCQQIIDTKPGTTPFSLVTELKRRAEAQAHPTGAFVTLASIHSAKGLEWDVVFLVGLVEGNLPIRQAIQAGDYHIEEERRLLYVGVTRAREQLYLSWALAREEGQQASRNRTRFLDNIVDEAPQRAGGKQYGRRRKKLTHCKQCGLQLATPAERIVGRCEQCTGDTTTEVIDALRTWRLNLSRANNVPAWTVFTDATLLALAEALPSSESDLLAISGIGPMKVAEFGEDLIALLQQFR